MKIQAILSSIPPLYLLGASYLEQLLKNSQLLKLNQDQLIIQAQQPWPGLYLVVKGGLCLTRLNEAGQAVLETLKPGQFCGEKSLLHNQLSPYSAHANQDGTQVLHISLDVFQAVLDKSPKLAQAVLTYQTRQALLECLVHSPVFTHIPTARLQRLIDDLKHRQLCQGEMLIRQGDQANEAYLIEQGTLGVYVDEQPGQRIRSMQRGELVGEIALLKQSLRTCHVIAEEESSVLVIPEDSFKQLLQTENQYMARFTLDALVQERLATTQTDLEHLNEPHKSYAQRLKERLGLFPLIKVTDSRASGLACLAMIAKFYGKSVDVAGLEKSVDKLEDLHAHRLSQLAEQIQFIPIQAFTRYQSLLNSSLPVMVRQQQNHWLVLYGINPQRVSLADPLQGKYKLEKSAFMTRWTADVLFLKPTEHFFD